jgi:hypothetical protein
MKKILLDENLPKPLKKAFSFNHVIYTVPELGWGSKKNGDLLKAMQEKEINILITVDKNLRFQQNISKYSIQVILLLTFDNRLKTLLNHISKIEEGINNIKESDKVVVIDLRV